MPLKTMNLVFHSASVFACAMLCSSCAAPGLDLDAEAQLQSPTETQSEERVPQLKRPVDEQTTPAPLRAVHPAKVYVSRDEEVQDLKVEVTFDRCKPGGFVYDRNSLEIDVDHIDRSITVSGRVEYIEDRSSGDAACANRPEPIVLISENALPEPYLVKNTSAWLGRGGNGMRAYVSDFRTPARVDADLRECLSQNKAEIGDISGVWFTQSDPANALSLSANASMMTPDAVMRTWVGSSVPLMIESQAPYTFNLPTFDSVRLGTVVFQSSTCARVYSMTTGERTDVLFRQTPEFQ